MKIAILIADAKGKVLYNFPFREILQDDPDPQVVGDLADADGEDREKVASWINEDWSNEDTKRDSKMRMREMKSPAAAVKTRAQTQSNDE